MRVFPNYLILSFLLLFLGAPGLMAQLSYKDMKGDLRKLSGQAYISKGVEYAEDLALRKEFGDSFDLLKQIVKKGKSMGAGAHQVVLAHRLELLADYFPREDKYIKEIISDMERLMGYDPPKFIVEKVDMVLQTMQSNLKSKYASRTEKVSAQVDELMVKFNGQRLASEESDDRKEIIKLNKAEAYVEIEKLKDEREQLENLRERLSETVKTSEQQLQRRARLINEMTEDKAQREALIEYNKRMIDSLRFVADLDSINLISQQRLISEQEAQLRLQDSQLLLQESELNLKNSRQRLFAALGILGLLIAGLSSWLFVSAKRSNSKLAAKTKEIEKEKERSEELLLNILPKYIAQELKENASVQTRRFDECTVLFTDFINFSRISQLLSPEELISALDECFKAFDDIISRHNVEKIKTIGDAYMCAAGVPISNKSHARDAVQAAIEMVNFLDQWNAEREANGKERFDARIGIHTGPIIAGVVGVKKFAYDIWGNTVNIAARMESQSQAQKINISQSTYELIKDEYSCESRGSMTVKNMKNLEMYFVEPPNYEASLN